MPRAPVGGGLPYNDVLATLARGQRFDANQLRNIRDLVGALLDSVRLAAQSDDRENAAVVKRRAYQQVDKLVATVRTAA